MSAAALQGEVQAIGPPLADQRAPAAPAPGRARRPARGLIRTSIMSDSGARHHHCSRGRGIWIRIAPFTK
jgi:hypothetical protein